MYGQATKTCDCPYDYETALPIFILLPFLAMCFCEFRDSQEQNIKQNLRISGKTRNPEHICEKVVVGGRRLVPPWGRGGQQMQISEKIVPLKSA